MSETSSESAENQPGAAGSSEGSAGTPEPTPGAPGQPDAAEQRRRALQSDLDRERARAAQLEKDLAEARSAKTETGNTLDAASVRAIMAETMRRSSQINSIAEKAKTDYPMANSGILAKRDDFESPEAFELALKESHESEKARDDARREQLAAEIREEYGIKLVGSSAGGNANVATQADQLTAAQVANADIHQLRAMDDEKLKALAHSLPEEG
jgi:hypothetical protein